MRKQLVFASELLELMRHAAADRGQRQPAALSGGVTLHSGANIGFEGELREVLRHGDDSHLPTPGLFFYVQGILVMTRNLHVGLKLVKGAPFTTAAVAEDVTFHLGPTIAVLLQSDSIADLAIPGLSNSIPSFSAPSE
ncbi:hypothetical protein PG997_013579 [Apiospora hydei]|uniref:Uncharacterized protein n=1 Tax=Apiospora hydei TaxID=1337664 RepID=A0ABR1V7A9_9PEZI